jgi:HAD superfamily phosphoserine phosphatase-like hydrolase
MPKQMPGTSETGHVYDVFICHASEDTATVAIPLSNAFRAASISFWLDEGEINWGDSIITKVNEGLSKSRYVVVILSSVSADKNWPLRELNAILNIEASTGDVKVLPLLVGTREVISTIYAKMPLLNDKQYLTWNNNADEIVKRLLKRLSREPATATTTTADLPKQEIIAPPAAVLSKAAVTPPDWLKYKVVAFDMDGTILKGYTFSWTLVWDYLKYPKKLQKTGMQRYRAGKTSYKEWCEWACNLFIEKNLKRTDFPAIMQPVTLTNNFYDTIRILKKEGIIVALISGGIDTFLEARIPDASKLFDYIFVNKLTFDAHERLSGVITTDYDFGGKARALELICAANGCTINESVFIGEGFNDQEIANIAGLTIAYPPSTDQGVSEVAGVGIQEDDLSRILEHIIAR